MTIERLDNEMDALERRPAPSEEELVSSTDFGAPHDLSRCPLPSSNGAIEKWTGRDDEPNGHAFTSARFGRMINIGGMHEADYLGFEDFVPDPRQDKEMQDYWVHGRPFTSAITADTVNICFRSTPVDAFIRGEIRRIAMRDARLTIVGKIIDPKLIDFVRGIGIIESTGAVWDVYSKVGRRKEPHIPRRENSRAAPVISVANLIADLKAPAPGIGAQRTRRAGQEGGSVSLSHLPTASDLGSPPPL